MSEFTDLEISWSAETIVRQACEITRLKRELTACQDERDNFRQEKHMYEGDAERFYKELCALKEEKEGS